MSILTPRVAARSIHLAVGMEHAQVKVVIIGGKAVNWCVVTIAAVVGLLIELRTFVVLKMDELVAA